MNQPPLFFLAFANDQDAWLNALSEEERNLRNALSGLHDQKRIELLSLGSTNVDDIYKTFNRYHNRINIFHFGGHSGANFLQLADQKHRATNLARLMGMQDQLQLVVLNGCANREQVATLLDAGVKVVIATSKEINDQWASVFAIQFYDALQVGKNIRQSFDTAIGYLEEKNGFNRDKLREGTVSISRAGRQGDLKEEEVLPWGLYWQNEEVLNWTISNDIFTEASVKNFQEYQEEVSINLPAINQELVVQSAQGLIKFQQDVQAILGVYQQSPNPGLFNSLQNLVIDKYPSVIGIQIRDLFTPDARTKGRLRLKELNEVYITVAKLLANIALANLWEVMLDKSYEPKANFIIRQEYRDDMNAFLNQNAETARSFDYIWLFATVHRILKENEIQPFLKEINDISKLLQTEKASYDAYRFMEQELRQRLVRQDIHTNEVVNLCLEAEKQLGILLNACGFLSAYEFVSVKDIAVRKRRRRLEPAFVHEKAVLRGRDLNTIDNLPLPRKQFTDDRTLLVTRSLADHDADVLSLAPFLIDLNAFSLKGHALPRLYAFHHREDRDTFVYQNTEVLEDFFVVSDNYNRNEYMDLELLIELFQEFEQDLNR